MSSYEYYIKQKSFSLASTLECGQSFRVDKIDDNDYIIVAFNRMQRIKQEEDKLVFFDANESDFKNIWEGYFDFKRDYEKINNDIFIADEMLKEVAAYAGAIRVLNQDILECIISYIVSANNRIPMIKKSVNNICTMFGQKLCSYNGIDYYSFPTIEQLAAATEKDFSECRVGFRAKYLVDAVKKINSKEVDISTFSTMTTQQIKSSLMKINGIGDKVSDCIILYSCGRTEVFPTDVWIKRVMQHFYFEGKETPIKMIHSLAQQKFGVNAGFAQIYLFHLARLKKIGKQELNGNQ